MKDKENLYKSLVEKTANWEVPLYGYDDESDTEKEKEKQIRKEIKQDFKMQEEKYKQIEELARVFIPTDEQYIMLSREEYEKLLARPLKAMGDFVISKIKNKDYELVKKENYDKLCHLAYFGYDDVKEQSRKETTEDVIKKFISEIEFHGIATMDGIGLEYLKISSLGLREIAREQFGVEVDNTK